METKPEIETNALPIDASTLQNDAAAPPSKPAPFVLTKKQLRALLLPIHLIHEHNIIPESNHHDH